MKKFLAFALIIVLSMSLVGCIEKDKTTYTVTNKNGAKETMTHKDLLKLQNDVGQEGLKELEIAGTGVVTNVSSTKFSNTYVKKNGNRGLLEFTIELDTGTSISVDLYLDDPGYNANGKRSLDIGWFAIGDEISFNTANSDLINDVIGTLVQESGTCTSVREDGGVNIYFEIILEEHNGFFWGADVVEAFHEQSTEIVKNY